MIRNRFGFGRWIIPASFLMGAGSMGIPDQAAGQAQKTPGHETEFKFTLRSRVDSPGLGGACRVVEVAETWNPGTTAIIVCDMWDLHHCLNAVRRETELAPRMDQVLKAARDRGVTIIHAPSSCMEAYRDHPSRIRAIGTPRSHSLPAEIGQWCKKIPAEEQEKYPVDQTDGGEDDDPAEHLLWAAKLTAMGRNPKAPWKSQTAALTIDSARDYISDDGNEIWSVLDDRRISQVILMGVHTNMCVLGRPFGLRQMARNGRKVALMRDMTDTMYNPLKAPFVSHFSGTDRVIEHVERYVSPTLTSDQVIGGKPFRFKGDSRPHAVFLIAEDEYKTETTLPPFAAKWLAKDYRVSFVFDSEKDKNTLTGASALDDADVLIVSARRRAFPESQVAAVKRHVAAGKGVVGIRTASHAFALRGTTSPPEGHAVWPEFDAEVLGGHYTNHHAAGPKVKISAHGTALLTGIDLTSLSGQGSLYKVRPLATSAMPILTGEISDHEREPLAWTNLTTAGGRVFYTSLGHADEFVQPGFQRLLRNAIDWTAGRLILQEVELASTDPIPFPK